MLQAGYIQSQRTDSGYMAVLFVIVCAVAKSFTCFATAVPTLCRNVERLFCAILIEHAILVLFQQKDAMQCYHPRFIFLDKHCLHTSIIAVCISCDYIRNNG